MQTEYPKKYPSTKWDGVHVVYPVRKFPETGKSSENIARQWKRQPEVLTGGKKPIEEMREYLRNYNITKELTRSQTSEDFGYKSPDTKRFNKHTSSSENQYIYPVPRRAERTPLVSAHSETEMQRSYTAPRTPPRLVTDKDQFKHPASLPLNPPEVEPSWHKDLEPLDTTYEGFEKYLDPYLTTSRLYHRPYTADQLAKPSGSKDIATFYTFANVAWTRSPNPAANCQLPLSKPKSMYDREKFKEEFREIRTHNQPRWTPSSFRTETRDNYRPQSGISYSYVDHLYEDVKNLYSRRTSKLSTNDPEEHSTIHKAFHDTETSHIGSGRPLCSVVDQYVEKNKRLQRKNMFRR